MGISVVTRLIILSPFLFGLPVEAIAQGRSSAPRTVEHRVTVVVPVIVVLVPPEAGSADRSWRVRTNDPTLRRRLLGRAPVVQGVGDTVRVTIAPP